jgi:hypothetical protein
VKFDVEQILTVQGRAYVLARQREPSEWKLGDNSLLGGVPIEKWTDIPRSHDANGNQRLDLFAFVLRDTSMASQFAEGVTVELVP